MKRNLSKWLNIALLSGALVGFGMTSTAMAESPAKSEKTTKGKKNWKANWSKMSEQERLEAMDNHLDKRMAKLTKALKLTDKQSKTLRQLFESRRTEVMDARTRNKGDRKKARQEIMKIKKSYRTKIQAVLTKDQQKAMGQLKQQHHQKRADRRLAWMKTNLKLTDKQVKQIQAIQANKHKQMKAIMDANKEDRAKARPKIKALRKDTHAKIKAVLTKDQQATFQKLRANKQKKHHHHGKGPF